jgi:beta-glucosidase
MKELKDFARVSLEPGQTKTIKFTLTPAKLQFYNREMKRVVEPGTFQIMIGGNSADLMNEKLEVVEK